MTERLTWLIGIVSCLIGIVAVSTQIVAENQFTLAAPIFFLLLGFAAIALAIRSRARADVTTLTVEGIQIDSFILGDLRRTKNDALSVHQAVHRYEIDGRDLGMLFIYRGISMSAEASGMEFSITADHFTPFEELDAHGYDVLRDVDLNHRIRPVLLEEGISKKVKLPFLAPVRKGQPFHIHFLVTLRDCITTGRDYVASTLSFASAESVDYTIELAFRGSKPLWVREYQVIDGRVNLLRDLNPILSNADSTVYRDQVRTKPIDARILVFDRR